MRSAARDEDERSRVCIEHFLPASDCVVSLQDVKDLVDLVVDVQRWTRVRHVRSLDERQTSIRLTSPDFHFDSVSAGEVQAGRFPAGRKGYKLGQLAPSGKS
jgi:hypothetical protein